ncbi:hypothetical protein GW765_00240 [Candidatus Parcubacteria bacterium]|nr:hypothetical protein [Candidatus Parcubacteria bacterium]
MIRSNKKGYIILTLVLLISVFVPLMIVFVNWSVTSLHVVERNLQREISFHIAEAGIDYYRWHLAHDPEDFQDGTGVAGPYVHDFSDKNGTIIGSFSLDITPPEIGSTLVAIESTGSTLAQPNITRSIRAQLAVPSLATFAVAANSAMRFGEGTEVYGPIHSNGGIRFDGLAHNIVTSAKETYTDTDGDACTGNSWGVHTCLSPDDPSPTLEPSARPDVFEAGREYPVPQVDFTGLTNDLSNIKSEAQASGEYFGDSGKSGYRILLKTDDTFDIYKVNSLVSAPSGCYSSQADWGTWSVNSETFLGNYSNPSNGLIFVEDDLWVEGQIDGAKLTIAAGAFPDNANTRKSITVNNDLLYTNYDGQDVLALISQKNINAGLVSADTYRIDAALIAQNGRVGRFYYAPPSGWSNRCSPYHSRDEITLYGMLATNNRYGFAYTNNTGYVLRNIIYDGNLLYGPPPNFPLTSDSYQILSWEEIE